MKTEGVELLEGNIDVQGSYKYLGNPQEHGNREEASLRSSRGKYLQQVDQVLLCQLTGKKQDPGYQRLCPTSIRNRAGILAI